MQTLNAMLRNFINTEYRNIGIHLPSIAFARNTTYNSVSQRTPFEVGHGIRARTICDARMAPRIQFSTDGAIPGEYIVTTWETTLPNKVLELATRLVEVARQQSE